MRVIGIDSGKSGYFCELNVKEKTARYLKIPYRADNVIDGHLIERTFEGFANVDKIVIEKIGRAGNWGSTQIIEYGKNYGMLLGLLHHVPLHYVAPKTWQAKVHRGVSGITAKEKSASFFASINPSFDRKITKANNGLVDAFLIARWILDDMRAVYRDDWTFIDLGD
jgi:hypothetical protein